MMNLQASSAKTAPPPESAKTALPPESARTALPPESAETAPPPEAPVLNHLNLEEIARKDKARLEKLLKNKGGRSGSYPRFTVSVKGQKVGRQQGIVQASLCIFVLCGSLHPISLSVPHVFKLR